MGVSGSGKTTVGRIVAERLGWPFLEGDDYHPPANVAKMRAGVPLDDADRAPWLAALATEISAARRAGRSLVLACSALRRAYRDTLTAGRLDDVLLVFLTGDRALLDERVRARRHFMPPDLLDSQLATLEPPGPDERPLTLDVGETPEALAEAVVSEVRRRGDAADEGGTPGRS